MKKTIFLIAMALIAIVAIRCKEDAEIPALKFEINASTDETLTERGVNDNAVINFEFKADYDYATAPLSFKIDYDKQGILKLGNEELTKDTTYNLDKPELSLSYVGKEEGKHTIKVYFFNDKGIHILKEIEIPYAKYNFAVAVTGDETVYQGEMKEYKLTITPENATVKDNYKIKFISYDENDPALQKSYVALNGSKIEYNKAYEIADITKEQKINLKSFHSGAKKLIYIIINSSSEKQEKISQEVKAAEIVVKDLNFNKLTTNTLDDNLQLRGFVTKVPALSNKTIFYRTWIVDVPNEQKEGVENTDNTYKDFTLPNNNEFVINVKVKKYGTYKYMLQFKDEFGNETEPRSFEIKAIDKNFEIEQKVNTNLSNILQGQDVEVAVEIKEANVATNEEYQIQFLKFDSADDLLKKSKIIFNNERVRLNEWYTIKKGDINKIIFNSFNIGDKKIVYKIKNSIYSKEKELSINIKKTSISIKNLSLNTDKIYIDKEFKLEGKIEKTYSENKNIEYKTWLSAGNNTKFKDLANTYKNYELLKDNMFSLTFKAAEAGRYVLKIQAKDEFGNESEIKEFQINVIGNEFAVEQKLRSDINNLTQGQEVQIDLEVKEGHNTNEQFQIQFLSFDPSDIYLQKAKIKLNGQNNIQLNKWYTLNKNSLNNIVLATFNSGNKKLVYQVKNSMYTKSGELNFSVKKTEFSLKNIELKATNIYINQPFKIEGTVEKTHSNNKNIEYKAWLSSGNNTYITGVTETYKTLSLTERNQLSLQFTPTKEGKHTLKIQAKDEFGNESEIKEFQINVIGNEFAVEQKLRSDINNLTQGQEVQIDLEVKEGHNTNEQFQIQFLSFDPSDIYLQKAKIKLNGQNNIQLNKWYTLNKNSLNNIVLATFNSGNKKLVYQIKNSMYTKNNELSFNVKKATISLNKLSLKTNKGRVLIDEAFKIEGKVEKTYPNSKTISYRTWLSAGNTTYFKELTNIYREFDLDQDNIFSLNFKVTNAGNYTLKIQAKDEFGNESEVKEFAIVVKNNEFEIEQKINTDVSKVLQGQEVDIDFKIKEEFETNETFQIQFTSFDSEDLYLSKSEIKLNDEKIQLNKWYLVNKTEFNKIKIKSFKYGVKKLMYQVKNSAYTKNKEVNINILKEEFTVLLYSPFKKIAPNKPFNFKLKITPNKNNHNKEIKYYFKSDNIKIKYKEKSYSEGEVILIELGNGQNEIEMEGIYPFKNSGIITGMSVDENGRFFSASYICNVYNSDGVNHVVNTPELIDAITLKGIEIKRTNTGLMMEKFQSKINKYIYFGSFSGNKNKISLKIQNGAGNLFTTDDTYNWDNANEDIIIPTLLLGKINIQIYYDNKLVYKIGIDELPPIDNKNHFIPLLLFNDIGYKDIGTRYYENYDHILK